VSDKVEPKRLTCPVCHRAITICSAQDGLTRCPFCGAAVSTELGEASSLLCPACGLILDDFEYHRVILHSCPCCGGIWCDSALSGAARALLNSASIARNVAVEWPGLVCPRCEGRRLLIGRAGPIHVYHCKTCSGIFVPSQSSGTDAHDKKMMGEGSITSSMIAILDVLIDFTPLL
jgi:hypothetical protein